VGNRASFAPLRLTPLPSYPFRSECPEWGNPWVTWRASAGVWVVPVGCAARGVDWDGGMALLSGEMVMVGLGG
jgi:hypothetical protein